MRRRRFTDAQIEKWRDDSGVGDIPCVDERFRGGVGELGKAGGGLLRSDKGADRVDAEILVEVGELERERVIGSVWGRCSSFTNSMRESDAVQGSDTHHYKRQHLGHLALT